MWRPMTPVNYPTVVTATAAARDFQGNVLHGINPFFTNTTGDEEETKCGRRLFKRNSNKKPAVDENTGTSEEKTEEIVNLGDPRIFLELPYVVMRNLLKYIDGESFLNLGKTSDEVFDAIRNGIAGKLELKFWERESREWYRDYKLVNVMSSLNGCDGNDRVMTWKEVHANAKDVVRILNEYNYIVIGLKRFSNYARNDMVALYSLEDLAEGKFVRLSGCYGPQSYHILWPPVATEVCRLYQGMVDCSRVFELGENPGVVLAALKIMVPEDSMTTKSSPFVQYGIWVHNYLIVINENKWTIGMINRDGSQSFALPDYDFSRASLDSFTIQMPPMATVYMNFVAIWSRPYNLQVFKVDYTLLDTLPDVTMLHNLTESTLFTGEDKKPKKLYLGTVWYQLCQKKLQPLFTFGKKTKVDQKIFALKIVHPKFKLVSMRIATNQDLRQRENELNHSYADEVAEELFRSNQPLRHSYTDPVAVFWNYLGFTVSVNLVNWHWKSWRGILSGKRAYRGPSCVEVIDSEVIAIAAEGLVYLARVCVEDAQNHVDVKVFRVLRYTCHNPAKIVKISLDYEQGEPYIWIELEKLGKKHGGAFNFDFFKFKFSLEPPKYPGYNL